MMKTQGTFFFTYPTAKHMLTIVQQFRTVIANPILNNFISDLKSDNASNHLCRNVGSPCWPLEALDVADYDVIAYSYSLLHIMVYVIAEIMFEFVCNIERNCICVECMAVLRRRVT